MSSVSVSSSTREKVSELMQEREAVRAMNASLRAYLEHLRSFRKNLVGVNENLKQLTKVNTQWIEVLNDHMLWTIKNMLIQASTKNVDIHHNLMSASVSMIFKLYQKFILHNSTKIGQNKNSNG